MKFKKLILLFIVVIVLGGAVIFFLKTAYVVPVLTYHSIGRGDAESKLWVSPESFARQMEFLYKNKYNVVGLDKIVDYIEGKEKIPPKTVAITFDDGLYNNYQYAYPVLKKYGFPATIFVIIKMIGAGGYVGWQEILEMSNSGVIDIESHTRYHFWLPTEGTKMLRDDLAGSKEILEKKLGRPVKFIAYPIGAYDDRVKRETRAAGYRAAFGTNPGRSSSWRDIFAIKRVRISRTSDNLLVFWFETSGYYTWIKEYR